MVVDSPPALTIYLHSLQPRGNVRQVPGTTPQHSSTSLELGADQLLLS